MKKLNPPFYLALTTDVHKNNQTRIITPPIVLKNKNRAFATLYKVQANTLCKMLFNFYV